MAEMKNKQRLRLNVSHDKHAIGTSNGANGNGRVYANKPSEPESPRSASAAGQLEKGRSAKGGEYTEFFFTGKLEAVGENRTSTGQPGIDSNPVAPERMPLLDVLDDDPTEALSGVLAAIPDAPAKRSPLPSRNMNLDPLGLHDAPAAPPQYVPAEPSRPQTTFRTRRRRRNARNVLRSGHDQTNSPLIAQYASVSNRPVNGNGSLGVSAKADPVGMTARQMPLGRTAQQAPLHYTAQQSAVDLTGRQQKLGMTGRVSRIERSRRRQQQDPRRTAAAKKDDILPIVLFGCLGIVCLVVLFIAMFK